MFLSDPDEMLHYAAFIWVFTVSLGVFCLQRVNSPFSDEFDQIMHLAPKVARPVGHMFNIALYRYNIKNILSKTTGPKALTLCL